MILSVRPMLCREFERKGTMEDHKDVLKLKDKHIMIAVDESDNAKAALLFVAGFIGGFARFPCDDPQYYSRPGRETYLTRTGKDRNG